MATQSESSARPLPRPTDGPYELSYESLFTESLNQVIARPEIAAQFELLQNQSDLTKAVQRQREVIRASVESQVSKATRMVDQLHSHLVALVAADDRKLAQLEHAATVSRILLALEVDARNDKAALATLVAYLAAVETWLRQPDYRPPPNPPDSPAKATLSADVLYSRRGRVIGELATRQVLLLWDARELARRRPVFRSLEAEFEAQKREVTEAVEAIVLATVLTELNAALQGATASTMIVKEPDNLRRSLTEERIVLTPAFMALDRMMRSREEASFGIAGPRGVGKSALIEYFTTTQGMPGAASRRLRLGVNVPAPVKYDARGFVLHLHAKLCQMVIDRHALHREAELDASPPPRIGPVTALLLSAAGAAAVVSALGAMFVAVRDRLSTGGDVVADVGALVLLVAALTCSIGVARIAGRPTATSSPMRYQVVGSSALAGVGLVLSWRTAPGDQAGRCSSAVSPFLCSGFRSTCCRAAAAT
ncbi:hypothetical protein [Saccharothrix stipae]